MDALRSSSSRAPRGPGPGRRPVRRARAAPGSQRGSGGARCHAVPCIVVRRAERAEQPGGASASSPDGVGSGGAAPGGCHRARSGVNRHTPLPGRRRGAGRRVRWPSRTPRRRDRSHRSTARRGPAPCSSPSPPGAGSDRRRRRRAAADDQVTVNRSAARPEPASSRRAAASPATNAVLASGASTAVRTASRAAPATASRASTIAQPFMTSSIPAVNTSSASGRTSTPPTTPASPRPRAARCGVIGGPRNGPRPCGGSVRARQARRAAAGAPRR